MKYFLLITVCCLLSVAAGATFELEDPADPDKQLEMEKKQKPMFSRYANPGQVVIITGTDLFTPVVEEGECTGWRPHVTEPGGSQTMENLLGQVVKTIECNDDGVRLDLSLVNADEKGLLWVESGKLLEAD